MYPLQVEKKIYTVSRLNQEVQQILQEGFGTLWLQGELSNFARPASGHFYFTLKDSRSQIRCAMFKGNNRYIDFNPDNGDDVVVRGKLGLYAARGDYQLIVEHMEPVGAGKLQAAFEATKKSLQGLGWFDQAAKVPLPGLPRSIGIVTSPTGAALRDVLQVLQRRYRQASVIIYPTATQGAAAAPAIARALNRANERSETDVLLLVRGGGSLEDLWSFNEVVVAEAIRESAIPVVSGVGHEVDITIADLVADLRAPTPSAAAELATPDNSSLRQRLSGVRHNLERALDARLLEYRHLLAQSNAKLQQQHPQYRLRERAQSLDELDRRQLRAWQDGLRQRGSLLQALDSRLQSNSPTVLLDRQQRHCDALTARLLSAIKGRQLAAQANFEPLARALHAVSPLAVLDRGYALVNSNKAILTDSSQITAGESIHVRLARGELTATVSGTKPPDM